MQLPIKVDYRLREPAVSKSLKARTQKKPKF